MSIAGLLIRRERLARMWSQEGLCRGICGTSYLSKIEQGKAEASEEILALLFARLGLSWTEDETLRAQTEACMEALFAGDAAAFAAAFAPLHTQERTLLCSPCAPDYLLLRSLAAETDGERRPLDAEFIPFLDRRQLALQRVLEGRHEEAALLYPAAAIRLWQGARLYAFGRYAAATEALRAAYDAAAAEGFAHIMMSCRVYLGNCCSDLGDLKQMQQHYAVAQRLAEALGDRETLAMIRYNAAATKIECGDFAAAYAYFSTLEEPDALALHKLAVCCEALGRRDEALAALARAETMLHSGEEHEPERQMLALVRCRLEQPDPLHDERYGALLTECFALLRRERGAGYARFHLPWMLAWYKANRRYREACALLEDFPIEK